MNKRKSEREREREREKERKRARTNKLKFIERWNNPALIIHE